MWQLPIGHRGYCGFTVSSDERELLYSDVGDWNTDLWLVGELSIAANAGV